MRRLALVFGLIGLAGALAYGLLQVEAVSRSVTPRRFWRGKILEYLRDLERARKMEFIKKIELRKKLLTGELDIAQDVVLGIDRGISISMVQGEIEKLKESVADSERAVQDIEARLTEAREKFNAR